MATHGTSGALHADFFADLVRSETRLYNHFNDELRGVHGITTSQYEFLRYVRDHDDTRATDMAAEFAIGVGAVSKAMDRLEERDLIERRPNPTNRRSMILAATDAGRALVDAAETTFLRRLDEILAEAGTPEQVAAAAVVLRSLRAALEREDLGTPVG
jgi:DNA-binding MarR family transcriptional regulator